MLDNDVNQEILGCKDLFVVLSNSTGNYDYIESYKLTNIIYSDDKFWGKFPNVHSACGHNEIKSNQSLSYIYNNFSNVVCTSGLMTQVKRFFSSDTYASMKFRTKGEFRKIWSQSGGDLEEMEDAVRQSRRLKLKIESQDNYTYILPLHTVEVDKAANEFYAETEYDGYPEEIRRFKLISNIEDQFKKANQEMGITCPSTNYLENSEFFLTSFRVYTNRIVQRYFSNNQTVLEKEFVPNEISIWEEL